MNKLDELLKELTKGTDFTKDQASVIAKQKLSYDFMINFIWTIVLGFISYILLISSYPLIILVTLFIMCFPIFNMIKIKFMPNLYIYEYILSVIKTRI